MRDYYAGYVPKNDYTASKQDYDDILAHEAALEARSNDR